MLPGIPGNAYLRERLITRLTNEAPGNVAPILPIEGAVTGGRSFWAWKRSGFLELQERFLEEITIATVWLFGVSTMRKVMDKVISALQKKGWLPGLAIEKADWSKDFMNRFLFRSSREKPSILLSSLERSSNSFSSLIKTLAVKGLKWAVAIAVPLYLCGLLIPRLNQKKTEWILKSFYANHPKEKKLSLPQLSEHKSLDDAPAVLSYPKESFKPHSFNSQWMQFPPPNSQIYPMAHSPPWGTAAAYPYYPYTTQSLYFSSGSGSRNGAFQLMKNRQEDLGYLSGLEKPRFGFSMARPLGLLSNLAHYVDNTLYGSIFAIDVGLTGGRMWAAWPRSPFESIELGARDAASLFFYVWAVPLTMKWAPYFFNSKLGSQLTGNLYDGKYANAINLDNQAMRRINEYMAKELQKSGVKNMTSEGLKLLLDGYSGEELSDVSRIFKSRLRKSSYQEFIDLMRQEMMAFSKTPRKTEELLLGKAKTYLDSITNGSKFISADHLEQFLQEIWKGDKIFSGLKDAQKFHLSTAVKLAFYHRAGLTEEGLINCMISKTDLPQAELELIKRNLRQSAQHGGDRVIKSILERSLNAAHLADRPMEESVRNHAGKVISAVEKALLEDIPVNSFVQDRLRYVIDEYREFKSQSRNFKPNHLTRELEEHLKMVKLALQDKHAGLSGKTAERLAELLKQNGRIGPRILRWMKGSGLNHLAEEIRLIAPLVNSKIPLSDTMRHHIEAVTRNMVDVTSSSPHQQQLIKIYQKEIQALLKGEGRASLLITRSTPKYCQILDKEVNSILRGGIVRNERLYRLALRTIHRMPEQSEIDKIRDIVDSYISLAEKELKSQLGKFKTVTPSGFLENVLTPLAKRNGFWRKCTLVFAFVIAALGVGMLIPKLQNYMTKLITGRDTHPGIAAVSSRIGSESKTV